jgi:hypothetical protein
MSLFRDSLRPPAIFSDEAVERYLAAIRAELRPDPQFRRRLRGQVLNRYVAVREGIGDTPTAARSMGRLGRAVLYATFTLAFSVTGVMAASQDALPGEFLYPLKRQVEDLRVQVLPVHLHDDLATYALGERIQELDELAERGDWDRVIGLAGAIETEYLALADALESDTGELDRHIVVLNGLLETLPASARTAVEDVLDGMPGIGQPSDGHPSRGVSGGNGGNAGAGNGNAGNNADAGGGSGNASADSTPKPTKEPKPTKDAVPAPTPKPVPTPQPQPTLLPAQPTPDPDATPRPTPGPRAPADAASQESEPAP